MYLNHLDFNLFKLFLYFKILFKNLYLKVLQNSYSFLRMIKNNNNFYNLIILINKHLTKFF